MHDLCIVLIIIGGSIIAPITVWEGGKESTSCEFSTLLFHCILLKIVIIIVDLFEIIESCSSHAHVLY